MNLKAFHIKALFISIVLLSLSCSAQAQHPPVLNKERIHIALEIQEHEWLDAKTYQFIAITVTGLPEVSTEPFRPSNDTISISKMLSSNDFYSGGYNPVRPLSRDQTFQPVHTLTASIFDTISQSNISKHTSLFLVDDFATLKKGEPLILYARGCFGYQRSSYASCNNFVSEFYLNTSLLHIEPGIPIADTKWYEAWLKDAPEGYSDLKIENSFYREHKNYEAYLKEIKKKN